MEKMSAAISDIMVMTKRNVTRYIRLPQLLVFNAMLNVVLLLLFNYVFGGAIQKGGIPYIQYFLPGFLAQTVVFGSTQTSVGIAEDLSKGLIDRFRSLPMARPAFLTGRVIADGIRYALLILLMIAVGLAAGFRFENGLVPAIAAVLLVILFGVALTWIGVFIGISVKNQETAQVAGFVWVFPLVFASSLYVPIATMPHWLQYFANVNPVTSMAGVIRALFLGANPASGGDSLAKYLWQILVWDAGLMLVFIPLSVRRYVQLAK